MRLRRFNYLHTVQRAAAHVRAEQSFWLICVGGIWLLPSSAGADGGVSAGVGVFKAVALIILAVMALGAAITYGWYRMAGRKQVWFFYPVIVAVILGGLWGLQHL